MIRRHFNNLSIAHLVLSIIIKLCWIRQIWFSAPYFVGIFSLFGTIITCEVIILFQVVFYVAYFIVLFRHARTLPKELLFLIRNLLIFFLSGLLYQSILYEFILPFSLTLFLSRRWLYLKYPLLFIVFYNKSLWVLCRPFVKLTKVKNCAIFGHGCSIVIWGFSFWRYQTLDICKCSRNNPLSIGRIISFVFLSPLPILLLLLLNLLLLSLNFVVLDLLLLSHCELLHHLFLFL